MGGRGIVIEYLRSCTAGALAVADCGPVWQLGIIAAGLAAAILMLVILRLRAVTRARAGNPGGRPPAASAAQLPQ